MTHLPGDEAVREFINASLGAHNTTAAAAGLVIEVRRPRCMWPFARHHKAAHVSRLARPGRYCFVPLSRVCTVDSRVEVHTLSYDCEGSRHPPCVRHPRYGHVQGRIQSSGIVQDNGFT
jgi:hypothetical protein